MNKINIHSHTKTNPTFVGPFAVLLKTIFGVAFIFTAATLAPSHALAWDCTLSASPATIQEGSSSTLSWTTVDSTSFSINHGVGAVTPVPAGSTSVSPTVTTTYPGTALGPDGSITCAATVTVTPKPPPPPPTPSCPLTASENDILVNFGTSHFLLSSQSEAAATYGPTSASVPAGTYDVTLASYDSHSVKGGQNQPNERYYLILKNGSTLVAQTNAIGDLPENDDYKTEKVNTNLVLSQALTTITAFHAAYPDTSSPNSITPICAVFHPIPPPPPSAPICTLSASPTTVSSGGTSTLTWTTTNAITFSIDNNIGSTTPVAGGTIATTAITGDTTFTGTATSATGHTVTCSVTITIPPPPPPGCVSNCGGGGGNPTPHILLSTLPHVDEQPLAYLYLSQIPYTGLNLGPIGTMVYWAALVAWALALAYLVLFGAVPFANRSLQTVGLRIKEALDLQGLAPAREHIVPAVAVEPAIPPIKKGGTYEAPRGYSAYEGFKSFAHEGSLSIDDIVKGLARSHSVSVIPKPNVEPIRNVEPIYENVEPIYENIEPIMNENTPEPEAVPATPAPTHVRGFVAALVEGDRSAVFAGLRQHMRGAGAPEKLISEIACLLDDAYRARVDGTSSDADVARLVARLDTPTLEKLVASLTTAIDSSYSAGATGAKIALTRALAVLGA